MSTILLRRSDELPPSDSFDVWVGVAGARPALPSSRELKSVPAQFEAAFDAIAEDWLGFARQICRWPTSELSHLAACDANICDFGEMLAWTRLIDSICGETKQRVLVVCDDPWLFRHLAMRPGINAGKAPGLAALRLALWVRGYLARTRYALQAALDAILLGGQRRQAARGGSWLLVYGHPRSDAAGEDGYFGPLPRHIPWLARVLHVDCSRGRARELAGGGRSLSLRAWGSISGALRLPFARWRPDNNALHGAFGWLVRRAAECEAGTAQAAAIRWQIECQRNWLSKVRPAVVAWPWEGHSWERSFIEDARRTNVRTVGYQHSVVGRHMLNYSPRSRPIDDDRLPERILCTGRSTLERLRSWGISEDRITIGGALRFPKPAHVRYDPTAPIFVALPFHQAIAAEMMTAVQASAGEAREFTVRGHPMTPFAFRTSRNVQSSQGPMDSYPALSAVLYAATTVGLEALIAGLPALRFQSRTALAVDILPDGVEAETSDIDSLVHSLSNLRRPQPIDRDRIFAAPDIDLWKSYLKA